MNVYQKINEVKKEIKKFERDGATAGKGSYSFVSGAQILETIKAKMEELGLIFIPLKTEHRGWTTFEYKNSYGDTKVDFIVDGKLIYAWVNSEQPDDRHVIEFEYYGQQNDISKAFGSALTYSERYLLLKSLGVPTCDDDPDNRNEDKIKSVKKAGGSAFAPRKRGNPSVSKSNEKTERAIEIETLIKGSEFTMDDVKEFIIKVSKGKVDSLENLTEEQYKYIFAQIKKSVEVVQ